MKGKRRKKKGGGNGMRKMEDGEHVQTEVKVVPALHYRRFQ